MHCEAFGKTVKESTSLREIIGCLSKLHATLCEDMRGLLGVHARASHFRGLKYKHQYWEESAMKQWMKSVGACLLALAAVASFAQGMTEEEAKATFARINTEGISVPGPVPLAGQATLNLPNGFIFVKQPLAGEVMTAMGNPGSRDEMQGLVFPQSDAQWFVTVSYEKSGHIQDDDAQNWDVDELLSSYKEGTAAANKEREKMGIPGIEVLGWAEKPDYNASTHRLAWAMDSREIGDTSGERGVNYNTYVLGREGYVSMNLVTGLEDLPKDKPAALQLIGAMSFDEGKRYADFNSATDHVAEYGLAALVAGVAAKKLGFLAMLAVFAAKFWKIALIGLAVAGGGISKFFKRDKA
jgi:uncharacterized membrane-anchored protein